MNPLSTVFAVKIFDRHGVGQGYLPRSQASLTQSEPRLWVRRQGARTAMRNYLEQVGVQFGGEIQEFELELVEGVLNS